MMSFFVTNITFHTILMIEYTCNKKLEMLNKIHNQTKKETRGTVSLSHYFTFYTNEFHNYSV